jgi:hypothetical protein
VRTFPAAAAFLCGALFAAMPARAVSTFQAWQKICVDAHAVPKAALTAADRLGWRPVAKELLPALPKSDASWQDHRTYFGNSGRQLLLTVEQGDPAADATGALVTCSISSTPPEPSLPGEVKAWAQVPAERCADYTCYKWREENGKHVPIPGTVDQMKSVPGGPRLTLVMARTNAQTSTATIIQDAPPVAPAPAAAAATSSKSFEFAQRFCFETRGDAAKALALADGSGWKPMPKALITQIGGPEYGKGRGRVLYEKNAHYALIVADSNRATDQADRSKVCTVLAWPREVKALERVKAMAAVASNDCAEAQCYVWRDNGHAHVALDDKASQAAFRANDPNFHFVITKSSERMSTIVLVVPLR